jgi:hypothetical protein
MNMAGGIESRSEDSTASPFQLFTNDQLFGFYIASVH